MRHPARALATVAVLLLTGCGSLAETSSAGPEAAVLRVAVAGAGRTFASNLPDPCAIPAACSSIAAAGPFAPALPGDIVVHAVNAAAENAALDDAVRRRTGDLPLPSWWNGICNANVYRGAKPLGASYRGVQACGPQPGSSQGRLVRFYAGAWGHYEWQCTELIFRFMYLAYGVTPYNAPTGGQVVDNWRPEYGGNFEKVRNGTGVMPAPGDILSTTATHTAIVTGVEVDLMGNGVVRIIEQNVPGDGNGTLRVTNWRIDKIKNWLHVLG